MLGYCDEADVAIIICCLFELFVIVINHCSTSDRLISTRPPPADVEGYVCTLINPMLGLTPSAVAATYSILNSPLLQPLHICFPLISFVSLV